MMKFPVTSNATDVKCKLRNDFSTCRTFTLPVTQQRNRFLTRRQKSNCFKFTIK